MSRRFASKLPLLNRLVADLQANAATDHLTSLSARERFALERYRTRTNAVQQWIAVMNGEDPAGAPLEAGRLPADCTEQEARYAWERELEAVVAWHKRRRILEGLRK